MCGVVVLGIERLQHDDLALYERFQSIILETDAFQLQADLDQQRVATIRNK